MHILGGTKDGLLELIAEARAAFQERERARTAVYFIDEYGSWTRVSSKPARPGNSVILGSRGQVNPHVTLAARPLHPPATAPALNAPMLVRGITAV